MTDDELRIIAFLEEASAATRPDDLPDWMLALLEGDRPQEMSHELITAASLIYFRRLHPGIGLDAARALMAEYADDPARLADLSARIAAFRLACAFERLKRGATRGRLHRRPVRPRGGGVGEADRGPMAVRQPGVAPSGRPARVELAGRPARARRGHASRGPALFGATHDLGYGVGHFGLRERPATFGPRACSLWGSGPGRAGPAHFGVRCRALWGSMPSTLGFDAEHFGVRCRALWGSMPSTLGFDAEHFGVRCRALWGSMPSTLGFGFRADFTHKSPVVGTL